MISAGIISAVRTGASTVLTAVLLWTAAPASAEDGYRLWLRYDRLPPRARANYGRVATEIVVEQTSPTSLAAASELHKALSGLTGRDVPIVPVARRDGAIILSLVPGSCLGRDGYRLRSAVRGGHRATLVEAGTDHGLLYGSFAYLRRIQTRRPLTHLQLTERPKVDLRMLDHWDNPDGSIERGYAGRSLWDWARLPGTVDARLTDYARANASVGINAVVLNNVNAKAEILTAAWLAKVAALADTFRPWGIRVFLSARFSAPIELGGLPTADPLDPAVRAWWQAKANEIYAAVPDFGGFLVKANSEGQPGPQDYHRSHADGANMLAAALAPHGGTLIWRAFVYSAAAGGDRATQAYAEFKPLDGAFASNVVVQVKNGPIDFQPREPFHPLFGAMPRTPLGLEVQITKEYLGFNTHLAYLGPLWQEVLRSDTYRPRRGATVARVIDGSLDHRALTVMAGVANTGTSRTWSGSSFDQANWYAFGRLAWNPDASTRDIAGDWVRMTWGNNPAVVGPVTTMMMSSRQTVVDYMTPLGLAHLMGTGHHYGPAPWVDDQARPEWNPTYYHRADRAGIGFDRTATGSNAVEQYAPTLARRWSDPARVCDNLLLWFHHVPWTRRLNTGHTLWAELVHRYDRGLRGVSAMQARWASIAPLVDPERAAEVTRNLAEQHDEAKWWRDASITYFQSVSGQPLPTFTAPAAHPLNWYKALRFPDAPGQAH